MSHSHASLRRAPLRLSALFALACSCLALLLGCAPFQQTGNTPTPGPRSTTAPGSSTGHTAAPGAVLLFDSATANQAITQWNLEAQSGQIVDGHQIRTLHDSGWTPDNFHPQEHLGYGFYHPQDPLNGSALSPAVIGWVEYIFFVTDAAGTKHYGLLLGTADHDGHPVSVLLWLDAHPLTRIVQLFSAPPVVEPFDWSLSHASYGVEYTVSSEAELAAGLANGAVLHHTIAVWFDVTPALSSTSAKGGNTSLSPAQVQSNRILNALTNPGASPPAGLYRTAPSSGFSVAPSVGATSPLSIILPSAPTPNF